MPNICFSEEYAEHYAAFNNAVRVFSNQWNRELGRLAISTASRRRHALIRAFRNLNTILTPNGFHPFHHARLDQFRLALQNAARGSSEADALMSLFSFSPQLGVRQYNERVEFLAAAKFFRHSYRVHRNGAQSVWVVSQPAGFLRNIKDELWSVRFATPVLQAKLNDCVEFFSATERTGIYDAILEVRMWCRRARFTIARSRQGHEESVEKLNRWFGLDGLDGPLGDRLIDDALRTLTENFNKIERRIANNEVIITDDARRRVGTAGTLAFVRKAEPVHVIYLTRNYFQLRPALFQHNLYAAIVLLHELSHREADTVDVKYDQANLRMRGSFINIEALHNADTYAYFGADCDNKLSPGQIAWAQSGNAHALCGGAHGH